MFPFTDNSSHSRSAHHINAGLFTATVVAVVLIAVGLFFWHQRAVAQLSSNFLEQAGVFAESKQYDKAAQEIFRYLQIQPDDATAQRKLADYHYESVQEQPTAAGLNRCVELQQQAILSAGDEDVRKLIDRRAEMLSSLGRYRDAIVQARKLFDDPDYEANAKKTAAIAAYRLATRSELDTASEDGDNAGDLLGQARDVPDNAGDAALATCLARLYRRFPKRLSAEQQRQFDTAQKRDNRADAIMDTLVRQHPEKESYLARFLYRDEFDQDGALDDLLQAMQADPEDAAIQLELARYHLRQFIGAADASCRMLSRRRLSPQPNKRRAKRFGWNPIRSPRGNCWAMCNGSSNNTIKLSKPGNRRSIWRNNRIAPDSRRSATVSISSWRKLSSRRMILPTPTGC